MSVIKVKDLRKTYKVNIKREGFKESIKNLIRPQYKEVEAIKNISFQIDKAELIGIVGLNGAGKTTLLKILSGLIYPTGGEVNVLDYNPWDKKKEFLKQIGMAAGQKSQLWWDLPAIELINLMSISIPIIIFCTVFTNYISLNHKSILPFLVLLIFSAIIQFLIYCLLGITVFWTEESSNLLDLWNQVGGFLSGTYFPLSFLPEPFYNLVSMLPFKYIIYYPIDIYLRNEGISLDILRAIGVDIVWIFILLLLLNYVWKKGLKKYTAYGM